ncbi:MAG: Plug domain-containing protein [Saprospiraceae bacterium]|nr:Plug domain-containing protein [Saprospiraceae bacterium]
MVKEASTRIETIPAEYETVTEQVLKKAAGTRVVSVPAEYATETERRLISKLPSKSINGIIAQSAGISSNTDEEFVNIRGSRSPATAYYIDGIRVRGDLIPQSQIEQVQILTGGTPASIGDLDGGFIDNLDNEVNFYTNQDGEVRERNRRKIFIDDDKYYPGKPRTYSVGRAVVDYGYAAKFSKRLLQRSDILHPKI